MTNDTETIDASTVPNFHTFRVKYLNGRVKIKSSRFKQSVSLRKDYDYRTGLDQAIKHLTDLGFDIIGQGSIDDNEDVLFSSTFKPLMKEKKKVVVKL